MNKPSKIVQDEWLQQLRKLLLETSHRGVGALCGHYAASVLISMANHGADHPGAGSYYHIYDTVRHNCHSLHPHQTDYKPWMF